MNHIIRDRARRLRIKPTTAESLMWGKLRGRRLCGLKFRRQHPIGQFIVDFACCAERLVVEIDGETHVSNADQRYDSWRTSQIESAGWRVIRLWNADVFTNLDSACDTIARYIEAHPLPSGRGGARRASDGR